MTALIKTSETDIIQFNSEQIDLIKRTIAKDATNDELQLFLAHCKKTGLDPLARQIYFQKYQGKVTLITSIDGLRSIAERSGAYAGSDDALFDSDQKPSRASVTVYKMVAGNRCPFTASARWEEYYPGDTKGFMWKKMPHTMLAKVAEGLALRKAFPLNTGGVYTDSEMEQANRPSISPVDIKSPQSKIDKSTGEVLDAEFTEQRPPEEPKFLNEILKILKAFAELGVDCEQVSKLIGIDLKALVSVGGKLDDQAMQVLRTAYASKKRDQFLSENKK